MRSAPRPPRTKERATSLERRLGRLAVRRHLSRASLNKGDPRGDLSPRKERLVFKNESRRERERERESRALSVYLSLVFKVRSLLEVRVCEKKRERERRGVFVDENEFRSASRGGGPRCRLGQEMQRALLVLEATEKSRLWGRD